MIYKDNGDKNAKKNNQLELNFSKYYELYDLIIKSDNFWKQLNDMIDSLELEKENQSQIIASISHGIKTPLTSVIGYSED